MTNVERAIRLLFDDPYMRRHANVWLLGKRDAQTCWEAFYTLHGYPQLAMFAAAYDAEGLHKEADGIAVGIVRSLEEVK